LNREFPKNDTTQPSIINGKPRDSDAASETDHDLPIIENSPKMRDSDHVAVSTANPVNSGVQNENYPMTEKTKTRDSDHVAESNTDPVKSDVSEQKNDHGEKTKNDQSGNNPEETLRKEIINTIKDKAPQTEFKTLTPRGIHDLLCIKFPGVSLRDIYRICQEEYNSGTLSKFPSGFRYNGGDF